MEVTCIFVAGMGFTAVTDKEIIISVLTTGQRLFFLLAEQDSPLNLHMPAGFSDISFHYIFFFIYFLNSNILF